MQSRTRLAEALSMLRKQRKECELKSKPTILKLGGSAITHKAKPLTANQQTIEKLAQEIAEAKIPRLIILHGGGSFGHPLAKKYAIDEGFQNPSQIIGFAETHEAMTVLNGLVVKALIRYNIPAVGVAPSSFVVTKLGRIEKLDTYIITKLLDMSFVPVLYGDAVLDSEKGFAILSGDQLVAKLAIELHAERIVIGVDVDGLYTADPKSDSSAKCIPHITVKELRGSQSWTEGAKVTDVTGGMHGKIIELIPAIEHGVRTVIVNATKPDTVRKVLNNETVLGTLIEKERVFT
jgi:isopentenyl phosphate kinase